MTDKPGCDVVVATRNRPAALERCLRGLAVQTHTDLRVVVVDDASDHSLGPVVERARDGGLDVTLLGLERQSGPAVARNTGAAAAETDYLVFIDDDVLPDRRLVGALLGAATGGDEEATVVSFGPFVQPADWELTAWNRWEAHQMKKEADSLGRGDYAPTWRQFHTGNNCMPVAVFRAVGGFNPAFTRAEDDELAIRLDRHGCDFRYVPDAIAWHYNYRTLEAWLAIPRAYARFDAEIDRMNPEYGYLAQKKRELGGRALPLRAARRAFGGRPHLGVEASVRAAQLLDRLGRHDAAVKVLSVAYDLSYVDALEAVERERAGAGADGDGWATGAATQPLAASRC